jgi:hypothetical protein
MVKPNPIRALKSSGVSPFAPTLIKRIQHGIVLKGEESRWASEIGPLSMLGELTPRQTSRQAMEQTLKLKRLTLSIMPKSAPRGWAKLGCRRLGFRRKVSHEACAMGHIDSPFVAIFIAVPLLGPAWLFGR